MAEGGEGELHNVNGEKHRIGWGGGGNRGGGRGGGRGRGRGNPKPFGFPILDEDTTLTIKKHLDLYSPQFSWNKKWRPKEISLNLNYYVDHMIIYIMLKK